MPAAQLYAPRQAQIARRLESAMENNLAERRIYYPARCAT
jgi:hypothetical protein